MAYVIVAVLVVLLVAGFVTFLVTNAASKRESGAADDGPPGIGTDDTPLGDTAQHAEERTEPTVVGRRDSDDPDEAAHYARPGEGEGGERLRFEPEHPAPRREQR